MNSESVGGAAAPPLCAQGHFCGLFSVTRLTDEMLPNCQAKFAAEVN